jgi:hypothetical protein
LHHKADHAKELVKTATGAVKTYVQCAQQQDEHELC